MDTRSGRCDDLLPQEEPRAAADAGSPGAAGAPAAPAQAFGTAGVAFVHLYAEASEPSAAAVLALRGMALDAAGEWQGLDLDASSEESAVDAWRRLRDFVGERPVVVAEGQRHARWAAALDRAAGCTPAASTRIGLDELLLMLEPGPLAARPAFEVLGLLIESSLAPAAPADVLPPHLMAATAELVARFAELGPAAHAVALHGWSRAAALLAETDPAAASRLGLALDLIDRPATWTGGAALVDLDRVPDGLLRAASEELIDEDDPLAPLSPAVTEELLRIEPEPILPPEIQEAAPFLEEDLAALDDVFREHLPALFDPEADAAGRRALYRKSQHRVAEEVARCLGGDDLLLVHAPTGTGKTLAYLLPALMWARRYGVRVGVATYTRALQSQAMDREVPRAFEALARAGFPAGLRVAILKGREASLCWRSLRAHAPQEGDEAEVWLAWTALTLFGLRDVDGDLDTFPRRPPLGLDAPDAYRTALARTLGHARARSGCCTRAGDRGTCAAEVARARAQRSHVVLTNQSFALARPEFFRRIVFDECEHLHDQAMSAWSHRVTFGGIRRVLARLHEPGARGGGRSKPPLDRLGGGLLEPGGLAERVRGARTLWSMTSSALASLESEVLEYERWRSSAQLGRGDAELYGLFREYVLHSGRAAGMVEARVAASSAMKRLESTLAQISEELEGVGMRGRARIRRALDVARADLAEIVEALERWLPVEDDAPSFTSDVFHDVERNARDEAVLAALVLLPGDALGRHYYPELAAAAFVSATTRLGRSFDKAKGYLGLDRVAHVDEETGDYDRAAGTRRVTTFHAPEVFDYGRVLVGVPRGLPSVRDREAYLDFLGRYLPWYAARSGGRMLVLFTSLRDVREVAERARGAFAAAGLPLLWQGMDGSAKEELTGRFREQTDATLLGVDTFWYGADFPGETLETVAIARLPYGVPDRYHHAQCAAIGAGAQRARIYMPRALAKFRQGFGRLMRRASDRGVVLVLDGRVTDRRHRDFLDELPVEKPGAFDVTGKARLVRGDLDLVGREAFEQLEVAGPLREAGVKLDFVGGGVRRPDRPREAGRDVPRERPLSARFDEPGPIDIDPGDLPY